MSFSYLPRALLCVNYGKLYKKLQVKKVSLLVQLKKWFLPVVLPLSKRWVG